MRRSAVILAGSSVLWILLVTYSIVAFYLKISRLRLYLGNDLFSSSWIPGLPEEDTSDEEWRAFLKLLRTLIPALVLQNLMLHTSPKGFQLHGRIAVSTIFLLMTFGLKCTGFIFVILSITLGLGAIRSNPRTRKILIYAINLSIVGFGVYDSERLQKLLGNPIEDDHYLLLFEVSVAWSAIRAISLGVTSKDDESIALKCCYFFYLPCLVVGPVTNYGTFADQIRSHDIPTARDSIRQAFISIFRAVIWFVVLEAMFHTIHPVATRIDFSAIRQELHSLEYFGFSAVLMAHFYVKYLIFYGMAEEAARIEGIWLPERPRCTLRLSSGAEVWRTFDRGLYLWFLECIYIPLGGRFWASLLCFVFVCFWHSCSYEVLIWCGLNFVLVMAEKVVSRFPFLLQVVLQCPLHWVAVGSNMFYLGGPEVGRDFFFKLLELQTCLFAFFASLLACVVGRHFQNQDKTFYRANAEKFNLRKKNQ